MEIAIPENVREIARRLAREGVSVYAVGGLVRNALLLLPPHDVDLCGAATPEEMLRASKNAGIRAELRSAEMGAVLLHVAGETMEYTTFRTESYARGGAHRPKTVRFGTSLSEDAFRRDFTVNALYADPATGEVLDPTGGLTDLRRMVIRTTHDNADEIMGYDALRVLRMVRFAAELGFAIDEGTMQSAKRNAAKLIDIAVERRMQELTRILLADTRYPVRTAQQTQTVLSALQRLYALGALPFLLPRLIDGRGVMQRGDYHRYDVLAHAFHTCQNTPPDLTLRLAGLLHDIGKPESLTMQGDFHAHARLGAGIAAEALAFLRAPNALIEDVTALIENHMYDLDGRTKEKTLRRRFVLWGEKLTRQLILLREADVRGSGIDKAYVCEKWRTLLDKMLAEGVPFTESALALDGAGIMRAAGIGPGPAVGEIKRRLLLHTAVRPRDNTAERLTALVQGIPLHPCGPSQGKALDPCGLSGVE